MKTKIRVEVWAQLLFAALGMGFGCGDDDLSIKACPVDPVRHVCSGSAPAGPMQVGFERCANGAVHRAAVTTCTSRVPRAEIMIPPDAGGPPVYECKNDLDCGTGNYCEVHPKFGTSRCVQGCTADAECGTGAICRCGDPTGSCVKAFCTSDADCTGGLLCTEFTTSDLLSGCPIRALACGGTERDSCSSDADCSSCLAPSDPPATCGISSEGSRACVLIRCAFVGRPFLVADVERTARGAEQSGWAERKTVDSLPPPGAARQHLADAWKDMALMEHASIAAFARFTLQLLSLGAPAELVEGSNRAQADETHHATTCFAVASAFAGHAVGPGPLCIDGALDPASRVDIVINVVREGCVGETVAALHAAEAAEHAVDPAMRRILASIAQDELAHAELAWRFVRWALSFGYGDVRDALVSEVQALRNTSQQSDPTDCGPTADERALLEGGVLPRFLRQRLRTQAIAEIILPCAERLLEEARLARLAA